MERVRSSVLIQAVDGTRFCCSGFLMMLGVFLLIFCQVPQVSWGACPRVAMETAYRCGPFFLPPPPPPPPPPLPPLPPPRPPREPTGRPSDESRSSLRSIFIVVSSSSVVLLVAFNVGYKVLRRERDGTGGNGPNNGGNDNDNNNNNNNNDRAESNRTTEPAPARLLVSCFH